MTSALLLRFFRCSGLSSSLPAGFPSVPSDSAYLSLLFVSFRPSLLRSHSRSTGACPLSGSFRPLIPGLCPFRLLPFVRFRLPFSATQLSRSSFPLLPSLALRRFVRCSFASFVAPVFLFPPGWFPILLVRFRLLGPLPRSLSSFPVHLPQLTSRCWPCSPLPFVRFLFRPSSFLASVSFRFRL